MWQCMAAGHHFGKGRADVWLPRSPAQVCKAVARRSRSRRSKRRVRRLVPDTGVIRGAAKGAGRKTRVVVSITLPYPCMGATAPETGRRILARRGSTRDVKVSWSAAEVPLAVRRATRRTSVPKRHRYRGDRPRPLRGHLPWLSWRRLSRSVRATGATAGTSLVVQPFPSVEPVAEIACGPGLSAMDSLRA